MLKTLPLLFCLISSIVFANDELSEADMLKTVQSFYTLNDSLGSEDATLNTVDAIFELMTDDFVYEHPKYGGVYSREKLYQGYKRNFERGAYKVKNTQLKSYISGHNMLVVKRVSGKTSLFEFTDGKISRIKEYW